MIQIEATQQCRTCGEVKPLSEFDVRADTGERKTQCKACRRAYQNARNVRLHPPKPKAARVAGSTELLECTRCGLLKPAADFPRKRRGGEQLHTWCRACFAKVNATNYAENREREQARIYSRIEQVRQKTRELLSDHAVAYPCACGERDIDRLRLILPGSDPVTFRSLISSGRSVPSIEAMLATATTTCRECLGVGHRAKAAEPSTTRRIRTTPYAPVGSTADTRRCTGCGKVKPISEFAPKYRDYRIPDSRCRECRAAYQRAWYERNRDKVIARVSANRQRTAPSERKIVFLDARVRRWEYLLAHPCVDCGETDPVVLEFDHRGDKRSAIVDLMRRHAPWEEILAEIEKCDVRCANCHRRRTARTRGYYRELNPSAPDEPKVKEDPPRVHYA